MRWGKASNERSLKMMCRLLSLTERTASYRIAIVYHERTKRELWVVLTPSQLPASSGSESATSKRAP